MHDPKVSLHIVTWNSMRFIPDLMESIMSQTYKNFNILVIDNGSTDSIEPFLHENYPEVVFIRNARNLGFSAAHNQGIRYAIEHWPEAELQDRFILFTNPDIILTPTFLAELVSNTRARPEVASFGGKLLRAFGENVNDEVFKQVVKSDRIDSVGLNAHKNRTVTDRGAGELDEGQYEEREEVFGISGALALVRAGALLDVRFNDEFFDQDFFAYKEDVDLAWRLRRAGWAALYVPEAVAYHYRGLYGPESSGIMERLRNRRQKSPMRNLFSTRNHWLMLVKNLSVVNGLLAMPRIVTHEGGRFIYSLLFESSGRRAVGDALTMLPSMLRKRSSIFRTSKRSSKDIRQWFR